jgi:hypothetical protein
LTTALTLASSLDEKFSTSLLNSSNSCFFEQAGSIHQIPVFLSRPVNWWIKMLDKLVVQHYCWATIIIA